MPRHEPGSRCAELAGGEPGVTAQLDLSASPSAPPPHRAKSGRAGGPVRSGLRQNRAGSRDARRSIIDYGVNSPSTVSTPGGGLNSKRLSLNSRFSFQPAKRNSVVAP